jgi:nitrite reductase (NO-forming)
MRRNGDVRMLWQPYREARRQKEIVMASHPASHSASLQTRPRASDSIGGAFWMFAAIVLGFTAAAVGLAAFLMWLDARGESQSVATPAAVEAPAAGPQGAGADVHAHTTAAGLESFAGAAPENAQDLAAGHKPYPAEMPALQAGSVANFKLVLTDRTVEVAPGVKYSAWAWEGGAPGPVLHVQEGQTVQITLTNNGAIPHSIDFHAARIAPNVAFKDVMPGESFSFHFKANDPGVYMYHCGTKPVLMHIANGMYGAIVVEPKAGVLPAADRNYVLVASEWYMNTDGLKAPAEFNMTKAHARQPDWMTFNGYAGQYVTHPLVAKPGELVRFWVVDAGPSLDTDFHVVGTIFNTAYPFGDMDPAHALHGVQTVTVPAGGGGVFDVQIDDPGLYPFVSHAFAAVDEGQVGLLKVGNPKGTMSH